MCAAYGQSDLIYAADRAGVSESDRRNFKFLQGGKKEKYEVERRKKKAKRSRSKSHHRVQFSV